MRGGGGQRSTPASDPCPHRTSLGPLLHKAHDVEHYDKRINVHTTKASSVKMMRKMTRMLSEIYHESQFEEGMVVVNKNNYQKPLNHDDVLTLIASLKACGEQKDLHKGSAIHIDIVRRGLLKENVYIGNTLLSMYAKCGALEKAQEVFDELVDRNVVSWNALIAGYAQHGHGEKALLCFECMQSRGFAPDACTLACILKACGSVGALDQGQVLHAQIVRACLLENHIMVGNALVDMYAKCGALRKAQEVFDELVVPDVVSWTALIAGYAQHGQGEEALYHFDQMQVEGISPNTVTFACILKACGSIGALGKGQEIHSQIVRERLLERHTLVSNALVDMYVKCGALDKAREVFDELPVQNVISWTALIAGYTKHGHGEHALRCYECMCEKGISPNAITFACILRACGSIRALEKGQELHILIERERLLEKDIMVANALIDMYIKCGALEIAQKLFDDLPFQNIVSWTTLIAGYADNGDGEKALRCFDMMQLRGLPPNEVTFACILKACGSIGAVSRGRDIHAQIIREHFLENHFIVANALVDMYAKCGALEKSQKVFNELVVQNIISWNALISGYVQHGHSEEALSCFEQMQAGGFFPNVVTFSCILKALGTLGALDSGQEIHAQIVRDCLLEVDIVLVNALLDMYVKCGTLETAQEVFNKLLVRDVVSWNTLASGYAQLECGEEALSCFERMQIESFLPDSVTFVSALKACGSSGAAYKGKRLHVLVDSSMLLENENTVGIGLLVLYANCGMLSEAQELFDKLSVRDVVSWSALMEGYAQLGKHEIVLILFEEMLRDGVDIDSVTFTIVLNACSHGGLLDKGQMYFEVMSKGCGMLPTTEHHNCMVDLLGRAGHLDKASVVIKEMPLCANLLIWHTFLGACQKWVDMKYGRWAFEHAVQLDEMEPSNYVSMSNIYAAAGRQEDASKIEALRVTREAYIEE